MMKRVLNDLFDENFIAVLAAENGLIIYDNPAARDRFGQSFVGEAVSAVSDDMSVACANVGEGTSCNFEAVICGEYFPVRSVCIDGVTVFQIGRSDAVAGASAQILTALDANIRSSLSVAMLGLNNVSRYMREKSEPSERSGLLALCQSCYRMLRSAGDLGLLASLRTGRSRTRLENLDVFPLLSEFVEKSGSLLEDVGINVTLEGEKINVITALDRDLFERLFYCLLAECLHHEDVSRITVRLYENQNELMLSVSDDGKPKPQPDDPFALDAFDDLTGKIPFELPLAAAIAAVFGGRILLSGGTVGNVSTVIIPCRILDNGLFHSTNAEYSGGLDIALVELAPFISSRHYEI